MISNDAVQKLIRVFRFKSFWILGLPIICMILLMITVEPKVIVALVLFFWFPVGLLVAFGVDIHHGGHQFDQFLHFFCGVVWFCYFAFIYFIGSLDDRRLLRLGLIFILVAMVGVGGCTYDWHYGKGISF